MRLVLWLPWPDPALNPNKRHRHWSVRTKAAKRARALTGIAARAEWGQPELPPGRLALWLTFYPPDKRRRDEDNLIAGFKPYRDGLADALGIDDNRFHARPFVHEETRKGGMVRVCITEMPEGEGKWE